jgi:glutaminyl-peptide cyclotransferase
MPAERNAAAPAAPSAASAPPSPSATAAGAFAPDDAPLPPEKAGGFDAVRAFVKVHQQVAFGPRPPGSDAIRRMQAWLRSELDSYGCAVEEDNFTAQTPLGPIPMKNILAKVPGTSPNIVLLLTHYDTLRKEGFVGANDAGSSTAVMLEMARLLCGKKRAVNVWIAFLDGEEAQVQWTDTDSVYGSRQLAAKLALSGDLPRIKAVILADIVGHRDLRLKRESNSTKWLTDLVWSTAHRIGYGKQFLDAETGGIQDDHVPFLRRKVPAVDLIASDYVGYPPWHTTEDTLDKISPRSLGIIGHVLVETLAQLEIKFR